MELLLVHLLGLRLYAALLLLLGLILLLVVLGLLGLPLLIGGILLLHELLFLAEPAGCAPLGDLLVKGSLPAGEVLIPILGPKLLLFLIIDILAPLFLKPSHFFDGMLDFPNPDFASAYHTLSSDQGLPPCSTGLGLPGISGTLLGELYGSTASALRGAAGLVDIALSFLESLCLLLDINLALVQCLLDFLLCMANVFHAGRGPPLCLISTPFPCNGDLLLPARRAELLCTCCSLSYLSWRLLRNLLWGLLSRDFLRLGHLFPESLCVSFGLSVAFGLRSNIGEGLGLSFSIGLIIVLVHDLGISADLGFRLNVRVNFRFIIDLILCGDLRANIHIRISLDRVVRPQIRLHSRRHITQ